MTTLQDNTGSPTTKHFHTFQPVFENNLTQPQLTVQRGGMECGFIYCACHAVLSKCVYFVDQRQEQAVLCEVIEEPIKQSAYLIGEPIKLTGKRALRKALGERHAQQVVPGTAPACPPLPRAPRTAACSEWDLL